MNNTNNINYIFHCGEYETKVKYKEVPSDEQINDDFDVWASKYGYDSDELDVMFDNGTSGYYET